MGTVTYEAYLRTGDETTDYELVEGELRMSPSPSARHQEIVLQIAFLLKQWLVQGRLQGRCFPDLDLKFDDETVLRPDISFVTRARLAALHIDANIQGAPDLVIEVLSPGSAHYDRRVKRPLYRRHGVRELWLVSAESGSVQVVDLENDQATFYGEGERFTSAVLGLEVEVDQCFPPEAEA